MIHKTMKHRFWEGTRTMEFGTAETLERATLSAVFAMITGVVQWSDFFKEWAEVSGERMQARSAVEAYRFERCALADICADESLRSSEVDSNEPIAIEHRQSNKVV